MEEIMGTEKKETITLMHRHTHYITHMQHSHGKRVGVAARPGKTKHFQTLPLDACPGVMLCDCPGMIKAYALSRWCDEVALK